MQESTGQDGGGPAAGCSDCGGQWPGPQVGELSGARLAVASAVCFLNPLAMAIAGALILPGVWRHEVSQLLGGLAGLALGIVASAVAARFCRPAGGTQEE